jgi:hypothetical protein
VVGGKRRRGARVASRIRFLALTAIIFTTSCNTPTAIEAWRSSLEQYVTEQGHGDLNVLRRADRPPSESDFGLIGATTAGFPFIAPQRTDANGVLLGHRLVADRNWFVYLVGMVEYRGWFVNWALDHPRVMDIRLIALSERGGEFTWMTSGPDANAVERYCGPQREVWQRSDPSRADMTDTPSVFPTDADEFQLKSGTGGVWVIDRHSDAVWKLSVIRSDQSD